MRKKLINIFFIGCLSLPAATIFASEIEKTNSNEKNFLYVNVNTEAGQEILKSEMEYKEYLNKKLSKDMSEKGSVEAYSELKNIKKAVAKLILEQNSSSSLTKEFKELSIKVNKLEESDIKMSEELKLIQDDLNHFKDSKIFMLNKENNNNLNVKKVIENNYKVKKYTQEELNYSFFKIQDKEFMVQNKHALFFKNPVLGEKSIDKKLQGESFIADMYTEAGWVHAKNYGWVKGYLLFPKIMPHDNSLKNLELNQGE